MKKMSLFLVLIVLLAVDAFAATYNSTLTKHIAIQGGYGAVIYVTADPIASQSQGYIMGMPFSIEDRLVQFDYQRYGRQVAQWSMMANSGYNIKVKAPDLEWIKNDSYSDITEYQIPYILTFESQSAYYTFSSTEPFYENKVFAIWSDGALKTAPASHTSDINVPIHDSDVPFSLFEEGEGVDYGSIVGSADGVIYFKLADNADVVEAPGGDYEAHVQITVETI